MSALFLEIVAKSSLLIGAGAVASILLKRRGSAATRHLVWTLVIAGVLLLPLFSISVPSWELKVPIAPATSSAAGSNDRITGAAKRSNTSMRPEQVTSPAANVEPARSLSSAPGDVLSFAPILLIAVYGAGVPLLVARFGRQRRMVARLARSSRVISDPAWTGLLDESAARLHVRHQVRLLRSCEQTVPMAFGTRIPTIVVPAIADTWDDARRRAVLLHELAHIVRRDCATQMVAAITCALYWFHPGVWWTAKRLRDESEIACDDCVLAAGTRADDYAGHLLELAYACVSRRAPALAVSMARSSEIESRLRAILDGARNRRSPALFVTVSAGIVAAIVLAVVAAARATMVPVGAQAPTSRLDRVTSQQPGAESPRIDPGTRAIAEGKPGAWEIWASTNGVAEIRLSERRGSWHSFTTDISAMNVSDGAIRRSLQRDAGTFTLEGVFRSGVGAGTFTFAPSQTFPSELAKRGYATPTPLDQYLLARSDIGFAFIDELAAQNYPRPDLALLVRAADHGVSLSHLREMGQLGYRLGKLEALITQVDHGVSPQFVRDLRALGFTNISADDLVRTRDHGVDAVYIKALADYGFGRLTIEEAVRARDHGIDTGYVQSLRQLGYRLGLDELIRTRDHGVDSGYITDMAQLGYAKLSIEDLVNTRDHGVDTQYVRELRQLGYQASLPDLIKTRDHGVDAQYVRDLVALGYKGLSLEQMIRLRDHGVDAAYIRDVKTLGYANPTPDDLVRLRDSGVSRRRLKVELRYQFERMRQQIQQVMASLTN